MIPRTVTAAPSVSRPLARVVDPAPRGWSPLPVCALALVLALGLLGCGPRATAPANLDGTWPETPGAYAEAHHEWTRHGVLRKYPVQVLELYATFKAPAWLAAHAEHLADQRDLTQAERIALLDEARAASEGPYEVHLLVTTHDRRENELARGERAPWHVVLVSDDGTAVEPESVERDRRPRNIIQAEFPDLGDFAEVYVARFPRTVELLGPGAKKLTLRMSSPRGAVELVWQGS